MEPENDPGMDLEAAARALGVHYQTAYRWVRNGVLPATKVSGEYRLAAADVDRLASSRQARQPLSYTGRARDWDRIRAQFYDAVVAGEETGARKVLERLYLARVPLLEQCEELVASGMRRLGDEWATGVVSSARVRVAAGIAERSLSYAVSTLPPIDENAPVALVVTPTGEEHRLPALMAGAVLRGAGWDTRDVEATPAAEVAQLARQTDPALIVISVTVQAAGDAVAELQDALRGVLAAPVLVGGPGESLAVLVEDAEAARAGRSAGSGTAPSAA